MVTRPPSSDPELKELFDENSPGSTKISVPVFIGHGIADQQVPVELSERLRTKYCALGGNVTRKTYEAQDHDGVIDTGAETDVLAFLPRGSRTTRLTAAPAPDRSARHTSLHEHVVSAAGTRH